MEVVTVIVTVAVSVAAVVVGKDTTIYWHGNKESRLQRCTRHAC